MEALVIIILLIISAIIIFIGYLFAKFLIVWTLFWAFRFLPFLFGVYVGIPVWFINKSLGNFIVIWAFVSGVLWVLHGTKENCQCRIHKIDDYLFHLTRKI